MRPIFGMSVVSKMQQQKYIDTDEDDQDSMFNDLPRKIDSNNGDEDEDDYGDDED